MLKVLAGGAAILATCVAASAADLPNGAAGPGLLRGDTVYNWSGIYAGISGGHLGNELKDDYVTPNFGKMKHSGFVGGVQVGFNKQVTNWVVGLEGDFSMSNARDDVSRASSGKYGDYTLNGGTGRVESSLNNLGTVRVRFGYAFDNIMLYGTGGYAFGRNRLGLSGDVTAKKATGAPQTTAAVGGASSTLNGWALGAGVEYAFVRGSSVKAEYLRVHLNDSAFFGGTWAETKASTDINLFRAGLNFRI